MIDSNVPEQPEIPEDIISQGLSQIAQGGLRMDFGGAQQEEQSPALDSGEPTPDEVWNYMAENRYRTFDHTTPQGRRMFELFEVANKEKNTFSFNMVKEMANIVASVPKDIVVGIAQNPLKAPMSALDGVARDLNDLYGIMAQSEDVDSPLFKFKEYLTGNGTTEERIKQFNEARMFNNKSQELQDGKRTMLEDFVPEEHKEFIKSMIDPKLANALSYIGLETPHLLMKPFSARKALRESVHAFKGSEVIQAANHADLGSAMSEVLNPIREHFSNVAERGKRFASQITGQTIAGAADAIATPFSVIQNKIANGARNIAETTGSHPNVIRNAASTALADAGETIVGGGAAGLSPIRSTLFSLGVKPLTEYASALGNEIVDYAQGVVAVKTEHMGKSMLERLSLKNGSRVPLSEEARMVAKFTNVVVGWPASMAMPVLKSAVGDAAYMGVLGYLSARGEGAAGAIGVGFAWGGISGSFRHIHNVYNGGLGQENIINNWDSQINEIEKNSPRHGAALRDVVSQFDKMNDQRISALVRASYMQLWSVDKSVELRFSDPNELKSEFPNALNGITNPDSHRGGSMGYQTDKSGVQKKVIWVNKNNFVPEAHLHEPAHALFDHLEETDSDFPNLIRQFFGFDNPDTAVLSDDALASLMAEYKLQYFSMERSPSNFNQFKKVYFDRLKQMRSEVKSGSVNPNELTTGGKSRLFEAYPEFREMMTEMFAYSVSNQQLLKTPDFFARHPESNTLRNHLENLHTLMNQRKVSKAEMAGLIIKEQRAGNNDVAIQTFMWEDGTYRAVEPLDKWCESLMRKCLRHGDIDVYTMGPERLDSFLKTTGKNRFGQTAKGGKVMKDRKEIDILITENAGQMLEIWEKMDPAKRPKVEVDQGGNKKIDLTNVPKDGWDALYGNINMTKSEIDDLRGIVEVIRDNRAGKPVFNVFFGQYLGKTHQVIRGGLVQRLTGKDVPVTYRHFSPFAAELRFDKFDENGKPVREPKGHVTLHVVDVAVLNRRRMKMWQRADVRALFTDFAHYTRTFTEYMHNLSQPTGIRVESTKLFDKEFGSSSAKVRDIMYETFGGRKRVDEGYINIPENGYRGNADGPNYPFHSLRFELLANLEKQPSVFNETFGNTLGALPYNHDNAYEGVRRNLMVGTGFRVHDLDNDRKFWSNGAGYEVRTDGTRYRLFSPYGNSIGVYPSPEKAFIGAGKHAKKSDPLDMSPVVAGEAPIKDPEVDITPTFREIFSGRSNLMVGSLEQYSGQRRFYNLEFQAKRNTPLAKFLEQVSEGKEDVSISLSELIGEMEHGKKLLKDYPEFSDLKIYRQNSIRGDVFQSVQFGKNHDMFLGLNDQMIKSKKFLPNVSALIQSELQKYICHKDGTLPTSMYHVRSGGVDGIQQYHTLMAISEFNKEYMDWSRNNPNQPIEKWMESVSIENVNEITNGYNKAVDKLVQNEQIQRLSKKNPEAHKELIGWARSLGNSFSGENPTSFILQYGTASIMVADKRLLKLPEKVMNSIGQSEYEPIIKFLQTPSGFTHGISKSPRTGSPIEIESRLVEESPFVSKSGRPVQAMVPNFILQNAELHNGLDKFSFFTITETGNKNDAFHTLLATNGGITTSTLITPNKPQVGSQTSDAKSYASNFLTKGGFSTNGTPITDINASLIWSGDAPFVSFEKNGMSFKSLMSGEHVKILQEVASGFDFISPDDVKQIASVGGIERFSRLLWKNGLEGVQSRMAYNLCLGAIDIQKGIEIIRQSEEGVKYVEMYANMGGAVAEQAKLGAVLMNDGYAKLVLTMFENGSDSSFGKLKSTPQSIAVFGNNQSSIRTIKIVDKLRQRYESAGYRLDDKVPHVKRGNASNLMVGGYRASTAKEQAMEASGMLRYFRDSRGNVYKSFEFTDASASLNMHAAEGSISKLPFIRISDEDKRQKFLKDYLAAKQGAQNLNTSDPYAMYRAFKFGLSPEGLISRFIPTMDLEEILHHDLLYKFYPNARDIKVNFTEGYGASFNRATKSITLGLDRFIGHELGLDSELTETQRALDAQKFGIDADRGVTEVLLHEVQHAIQMEEGWIDSASIANVDSYKAVFKYLMGKISGTDMITVDDVGSKLDKNAIEKITGDADALANVTAFDAINSIKKMFESPMHHKVRKLAIPAMHRVASSLAMRLHDEYAHLPDDFPDKVIAIKHANVMMELAKGAREVGDMLTRSEITESDASIMIAGTTESVYFKYLEARQSAEKELNGTPLGRSLRLDEPWDSMYLNKLIGTMTAYEKTGDENWLSSDLGTGTIILKSLVENYGWMQYLAQPHEVQASQTGKRRKMSQQALNASATETGYVRSGIEGFEGVVTQSNGFGPSIAELGRMLNEGADSHMIARAYGTYSTSNLMVGGLGQGVSVTEYKKEYTSIDVMNFFGRLATVSHHLSLINEDYQLMKRIAVSSSGFEVDKDGKVRLIFRKAEIEPSAQVSRQIKSENSIRTVLSGKIPNLDERRNMAGDSEQITEYDKELIKNTPWMSALSSYGDYVSQGGIPQGVIINNLLDEGNQATMPFEKLVSLLDAKVTMEKILETPIESINIAMRDDFPSHIRLSNLRSQLVNMGISEDGLVLGNIDAITDAAEGQDVVYTKQEIINILAINHQIFTTESVAGRAFGKEKLLKTIKESNLSQKEIALGMAKTFDTQTLLSIAQNRLNPEGAGSFGFEMDFESRRKKSKFFEVSAAGIVFKVGSKPDWIGAEEWTALIDRIRSKGIIPDTEAKRFPALEAEYLEGSQNQNRVNALHERATELNERFFRKMFLIRPFYESVIKGIEEGQLNVNEKMMLNIKVSMLSDAVLSEVAMNPEAMSLNHHKDKMVPYSVAPTDQNHESRSIAFGYDTAPKPFGAIALNLNALGTMASTDLQMFAERLVQNPAVGMVTPASWGYDSSSYRYHTDTPLNLNMGRNAQNIASMVYNYEEPANRYAVGNVMDNVNSHYTAINRNILMLNKVIRNYEDAIRYVDVDSPYKPKVNEVLVKVKDLASIATRVSIRYDALTVIGGAEERSVPSSINSRLKNVQKLYGTNAFLTSDGTYVVSNLEPVRTIAYDSHAGLTNMPYIYSGVRTSGPSVEQTIRMLGDMNSAFMRNDYERIVQLHADIVDENGVVLRNALMVYDNMLESSKVSFSVLNGNALGDMGNPHRQPVTRLRPSRKDMANGKHALHSALYQTCARNEISEQTITNALVRGGADSDLITLLKNHMAFHQRQMAENYGWQSDNDAVWHTMPNIAPALAPFFAKAMSEKQVVFIDGVASTADILKPDQRQKYMEMLGFGYEEIKTNPDQAQALYTICNEFAASLSHEQMSSIAGTVSNGTIGTHLDASIGILNALAILEKIPDEQFVNLDALLGRSFKEEMRKSIGLYAKNSASFWEKGLPEDVSPSDNSMEGYSHSYMRDAALKCFNAEFFFSYVMALKNMDKFEGVQHVRQNNNGIASLAKTDGVGVLHSDSMQFINRESYAFSPIAESQAFATGLDDTYNHNKIQFQEFALRNRMHALQSQAVLNHFDKKENRKQEALEKSGLGMGSTFLTAIDIIGESNSREVRLSPEAVVSSQIANNNVISTGTSLSRTLVRKKMAEYLSSLAQKGNGNIGVEPARFSMSGRFSFNSTVTRLNAGKSGSQDVKFNSINNGLLAIGAGHVGPNGTLENASVSSPSGLVSRTSANVEYSDAVQSKTYQGQGSVGSRNAPFNYKPQYGFAFKKLEDGSIVVNVTGDIHSPKYLLSQRSQRQFFRNFDTLNAGFSIKEGLGFDPYTKTILPHGPLMHRASYTDGIALFSTLTNKIGGPAWAKEIVSASNRIAKGEFSEMRDMRALSIGIGQESFRRNAEFGEVLAGEADASNVNHVRGAYGLIHHNQGHDYLTVTFKPNTPIEEIRAGLHELVVGLGAKSLIQNSELNGPNPVLSTIQQLDGQETRFDTLPSLTFGNIETANRELPRGVTVSSYDKTVKSLAKSQNTERTTAASRYYKEMGPHSQLVSSLHPHMMDDLDNLCGMIASKDSGYFLPSTERILAMNGDKASVIELMFPDRPDLLNYAWDGRADSNVSIVPKKDYSAGARGKVQGYMVGYDQVSGLDEYGKPVVSRKVVVVKTLPEAEAIRAKFSVSTSKAEMALIMDQISNQTQKEIRVIEQEGNSRVGALVSDFSRVQVNGEGVVQSGLTSGFRVGEMDKVFKTKAEAEAARQILESKEILSTPRANLMVGDRSASELENLTRAKLNFGSGYGPYEFVSKLMKVVAYAKKKTGKDLFPHSMTGNDWFKHIKENNVSKDEIRQSGLAVLLYEMGDRHISRQELAEFLYTVHPQTYRIQRNVSLEREIEATKQPIGVNVRFPFISDIASNAGRATDRYFDNLMTIIQAIEAGKSSADESTSTNAKLAEIAANASLSKIAVENGLIQSMPDTQGGTFRENIEKLREHYNVQATDVAPSNLVTGPNITIRPAYLLALQEEILANKVASIGKTVNEILGNVATTDPWDVSLSQIGTDMLDIPFQQLGTYGRSDGPYGKGAMSEQKNPTHVWNMGLLLRHAKDHNEWASTYGPYSSQVMAVEQNTKRQMMEYKTYIKELTALKDKATDPLEAERIGKIITGALAVMEVRKRITERNSLSDAGHYGENPAGLLQLGHLRVSEGVSLNEINATAIHENGFTDASNPLGGTKPTREPLVVIEEIQSDVFQYHEFGQASSPEYALPEDFVQVEGLKKSGEISKLRNQISNYQQSVESSDQAVSNSFNEVRGNRKTLSRRINSGLTRRVMEAMSPIELYAFIKGYAIEEQPKSMTFFKDTGRRVKVPESYRSIITEPEIPVYEFNFSGHKYHGMYITDKNSTRNYSGNFASEMEQLGDNWLIEKLVRSVNDKTSKSLHQLYRSTKDKVEPSQASLRGLIMDMLIDDEGFALASADLMDGFNKDMDLGLYDYDALAQRLVAQMEKRLKEYSDAGHRDTDRNITIRILNSALDEMRSLMRTPRSAMKVTALDGRGSQIYTNNYDTDGALFQRYMRDQNTFSRSVDVANGTSLQSANALNFGRIHDGYAPEAETARANGYQFGLMLDGNYSNMLSKIVASVSLPVANYNSASASRAKIAELKKQMEAMKSVIPLSGNTNEPYVSTSHSFGVEDIYRNVSFHATVMKAAAAGYGQIGMTDARHHFTRGNSTQYMTSALIGRDRFMINGRNSNENCLTALALFESLPADIKQNAYGNFHERLKTFSVGELAKLGAGEKIEHNGVSGTINQHVFNMLVNAQEIVNTSHPTQAPFITLINPNSYRAEDMAMIGAVRDALTSKSNFLGPDGKPRKYKTPEVQADSQFFANKYGSFKTGEKSEYQRYIDQTAMNLGQLAMVIEAGNRWGYASNYGLPMHYMELQFLGQSKEALEALSTDSFDRPVVTMKDGEFIFLDPKTAKEIGKTNDKEKAKEMYAQLSKYRGKNPYLKMFEKEYGPMGGYVGTAFNWGSQVRDGRITELDQRFEVQGLRGKLNEFPDFRQYAAPTRSVENKAVFIGDPTASHSGVDAPTGNQAKGLYTGYQATTSSVGIMMLKRGLDPQSEQGKQLLASMDVASVTLLRFKPRFPTEQHRLAWRKKAIDGIAYLMVGGDPLEKPKANPMLIERMKAVATFTNKASNAYTDDETAQ